MQATAFEYRHRYTLHGLIYVLCLAAPWPDPFRSPSGARAWGFLQNGSTWFRLANVLSRPLYQHFAVYWNAILVLLIGLAIAGAVLRLWGAAYLGASTVQRGGMVSDHVVADGPFRFVRNPLYLGTVLNTAAVAFLMRPDAAVLAVVLIMLVQFRLIGREEPFLREHLGEPYVAYMQRVPRLMPALRPRLTAGTNRPRWRQGLLSELYVVGVALTFVTVGWSGGFGWENAVLRVVQGLVISLGFSVIARAFIPKATF